MKSSSRLAALALVCGALLAGARCRKSEPAAPSAAPAKHEHVAPHGGSPVVLGDEAYHLELVRDAATGTLQVYVLDGEMENFIRTNMSALDVVANVGGSPQTLTLRPVANAATGETAGDTALFEGRADWLKTTPQFDATLATITIRGTTFRDVKFNFPKGNDKG